MLAILKKYRANIALLIASLLFSFLLAEGLLTTYRLVKYGHLGRGELTMLRKGLRDDVVGGTGDRFENRLILHPLFGYTYNPKDTGINNFGFRTKHDIFLNASGYSIKDILRSESLVVGIFGGSFAEITGLQSEYLEEELRRSFPTKKPIVMNFALGGQALPQSAFIFVYLKELFDVVVFIDGLNEPWNYIENNRAGFPPEYAKAAHYRYKISRQELSPIQFERTEQLVALKRKVDRVTSISLLPVLRQSLIVHYAWSALQRYWSTKISSVSLEIIKSYGSNRRFFDVGDDTIMTFAAHQWGKYHAMIHHLASEQGALSIHLLQPNPFFPNSKVLTPEEQHLIADSYPVEDYVVKAYPKIQKELSYLRVHDAGFVAEDLTPVFKNVKTSVWIDAAHANEEGSRLIMDKIAELIRANKNSISSLHNSKMQRREQDQASLKYKLE
jgi:hypothetical protein